MIRIIAMVDANSTWVFHDAVYYKPIIYRSNLFPKKAINYRNIPLSPVSFASLSCCRIRFDTTSACSFLLWSIWKLEHAFLLQWNTITFLGEYACSLKLPKMFYFLQHTKVDTTCTQHTCWSSGSILCLLRYFTMFYLFLHFVCGKLKFYLVLCWFAALYNNHDKIQELFFINYSLNFSHWGWNYWVLDQYPRQDIPHNLIV